MKVFKIVAIISVILLNLVIAQPSWADLPKLTKTADYTEVTQTLDKLFQAKQAPEGSGYTAEEIQQQISDLQLQKYILESARGWGQCRNETGKTLAVYAHKGKKSAGEGTLYFLGNGQTTDNDWNCDGIYLPTGTTVAGLTSTDTQGQELAEPLAMKIVPGTQLIAQADPETGVVKVNVPAAKIVKAGDATWSVPELSVSDIAAKTPNAPIED